MSMEIEIKYRLDSQCDFDDIVKRLRQAGASDLGAVEEENAYFDWPDGRLRIGDNSLRIRSKTPLDAVADSRPLITYKGPRVAGKVKIREEVEFKCDDAEACEQLFIGLGMQRRLLFQKRRHSFGLGSCVVEVDQLPMLGFFLEIEGPSEQEVLDVASSIGGDDLTQEYRSYAQMITLALEDGSCELKF